MDIGISIGFKDANNSAVASNVVSLDAPVTSSDTKAQHVYGVDRMVEGYTGNTIRVVRTSDSAESDFGFNSTTGIFDIASVVTWAGGSTVNVLKLYDQSGTLDLDITGTANLVTAGAVKRFGTTITDATAQLTRSTTNGGVGIDMGGNGYFSAGATKTNFDSSGGFEITMLWSPNLRKAPSNTLPDGLGGDAGIEDLFYLDTAGTQFFRNRVCASSSTTDFITLTTTNSTEAEASSLPYKQYAQQVASFSVQPTELIIYRNGGEDIEALNATVQSDILAGDFDESLLYIGHTNASRYPDILLGGFILSTPYTGAERYALHAKLNAIGQQHRILSTADVIANFDELVLLKNINTGTGIATGENGLLTLDFDTTSNNWVYDYNHPLAGLQGVQNPTKFTTVNGFKATDTYFSGTTTGSVMSVHIAEDTDGDLTQVISQATGAEVENESAELSLSLGYDHNQYSARMELAGTKDDDALIGTRYRGDDTTLFGANPYDGANQAMGKYNRNVTHTDFTYGETISGYVWGEDAWKNEDVSAPYELDAPVVAPCADNMQYTGKDRHFAVQFATFEKGANYNVSDPYATRKTYRLTSNNKSYLSDGRSPIGHRDGAIAINPNGANVHSNDNAYIQSHQQSGNVEIRPFYGTRFAFGFAKEAWSVQQMEEIQVNLYKLLT